MNAHQRHSLGFALTTVLLGIYAYTISNQVHSVQDKDEGKPEGVAETEAQPDSKPMAESSVHVSYRITNDMIDEHGRMYAGELLKMIDIVAGVASRRHAELGTVTISLDRFVVVQEVRAGDLIHLYETGVKVTRESTTTCHEQYCCHAYLTFVALAPSAKSVDGPSSSIRLGGRAPDANRPRPKIKKIIPSTLLERKRYILAGRRRELRLVHSKSSKDVVDFRAEVLAMALQEATRNDMINSSVDRTEALAFIEKQILADALRAKDPALVYSTGPDGEECVSITPSLLGDLDPSALDAAIPVKELLLMGQRDDKPRRTSWIGPGESMRMRKSSSSWVIDPRSPSKRLGGEFQVLSPVGEGVETSPELSGHRPRVLPMSATFATTLHMVMPQHANSAGILFGGQLMAWMEKTALITAHQFKADHCAWTTACMDGLEFRKAVAIGDIYESMEIVYRSLCLFPCRHKWNFNSSDILTAMAIPLRTDLIVTPDSAAEKVFHSADERKTERLAMKEMLSRVYAHQSDEDNES
ncbi:Acyl-coenzyme A thioesterase 12 [Tulasnella sp. 331]|nr:Acyl-coenzyme A thioesterase 12 [Tulasnella sp. 331]